MSAHGSEPPQVAACVECGELKRLALFHRDASRPNGHNRRCKECRNARNRQHVANNRERRMETMARWRRDNPERYLAAQRAYKMRTYGLTLAEYEALADSQGGTCAICGMPEVGGWDLAIDHDHRTGKVRGLLCRRCNVGIGLLRDDAAIVMAAAEYLRKTCVR